MKGKVVALVLGAALMTGTATAEAATHLKFVSYTQHEVNNAVNAEKATCRKVLAYPLAKVCVANVMRGRSWQRIGHVNGHAVCWQIVGPTTVYACRDGFAETS